MLQKSALALILLAASLMFAPALWASGTYKVLHAFGKGKDGGGIYDSVAIDADGNLYGTTWAGGAYGYGTVFMLEHGPRGKWSEAILHSFCADFPTAATEIYRSLAWPSTLRETSMGATGV